MHHEALAEREVLMPTYRRWPIRITKGKGSFVWDDEGHRYLDYTSGIAVCNLGHVPDGVKEKLGEALEDLWHCSNLFQIPQQERLARALVEKSCADQAFFCNSGAEANEAAIKLARRYAQKIKNTGAYEIVTFAQSFHGRTLAALSATGQAKFHDGFEPLVPGFRTLPYNDEAALAEVANGRTCAVLLELVQGEGGVIAADGKWVRTLYDLCRQNDILFMVDEVQTGIGRTGTLFAYEQYGIEPDVITVAKGLGSGFPIGAVLAKAEVAQAFAPGSHGSTFGGNPLAMTAGLATLEAFDRWNVLENVRENGRYLRAGLERLKEAFPETIREVRGKGMLLGIAVRRPPHEIIAAARRHRVLILSAGDDVVRILPPLTTTKDEIDLFLATMHQVFLGE